MSIPATRSRAKSRHSSTADEIKELILRNGLRPGDPLPTESELCDQLAVSRSSVREAIRTLTTLDIVEVRHGTGTFVGQMSLDALVQSLVFRGVLSPGDDLRALREVVEVRQSLDIAMTPQVVAAHRDTADTRLDDLVEEMAARGDLGEPFTAADREFHTRLLERAGNQLVVQLTGAFWDIHTAVLPRLGLAVAADLRQTARAHREMLQAARAGDEAEYHAAIERHYAPLRRAIARGTVAR